MNDELARKVFLNAFNEELEKISHQRDAAEIEKWASSVCYDWDDLSDMEKQAFIGRALKAVKGMFGRGAGSAGAQAAKKLRPKASRPDAGKFLQSSGMTPRGNPTVMRTARSGGFRATRGGGARTGHYTAGIPLNLEKMSHVLALLRE